MTMFDGVNRESAWRPVFTLPQLSRYPGDIGWDFESTGKNAFKDLPIGISICVMSDPDKAKWKRWYLPWGHRGGGNLDESTIKRWCQTELAGRDLVGLNSKTDVLWARRWGLNFEQMQVNLHDVAFPAALLNENRYGGFNLASLCEEYLEEGERKVYPETVEESKFYLAHAGEVALRAEQDAYLALRLRQTTLPLIEAEDLRRVLDLEDSIILAVAEMEWNGALIDRPKLELWLRQATDKLERLYIQLYKAAGFKVNPNSNPDMQRLFDSLKMEYPKKAEQDADGNWVGVPTFEEEYLAKIKHPVVELALETRKVASLVSKYLKKYRKALDSNNILRFQLHQLRGGGDNNDKGTVMGRFSSAAPSTGGANIQQVPKVEKQISDNWCVEWIIRELFIPDPEFKWVCADAAQIEYRFLQHYAQNKEIQRKYDEDPRVSFHKVVQAMVAKVRPDFPYWALKNFNFMKVYGGGRDKGARMLGVDRKTVDPLMDLYEEMFPEAGRLLNKASDVARRRKYVRTILGRRRRYPDGQRLHSALHAIISGSAADSYKITLRDVYRERKTIGLHKMRLSVHDEMDSDIDKDPKSTERLQECLEIQRLETRVPILWEVGCGNNWREAKEKE
jgi:DNA polymerase-1